MNQFFLKNEIAFIFHPGKCPQYDENVKSGNLIKISSKITVFFVFFIPRSRSDRRDVSLVGETRGLIFVKFFFFSRKPCIWSDKIGALLLSSRQETRVDR